MPLVQHSSLPTFEALRAEGQTVLGAREARHQDIRALHVGLLNMMPDAAFQVTEQQFLRLVGSSNHIAQFHVHCFTVPGLARDDPTRDYIAAHYEDFPTLRAEGLDALIVTGANVANPRIEQEPFYPPLTEVISWATANVASVLCSCLSTHALMKFLYGIDRRRLPRKCFGGCTAIASSPLVTPSSPSATAVSTFRTRATTRSGAPTSKRQGSGS